MLKLQHYFEGRGYEVYNLPYLSTYERIEDIAQHLAEGPLAEIAKNKGHENGQVLKDHSELNFVVHSMGGLILRYMHQFFKTFSIGKVVMLGTPNHGSELADRFHHLWLYKQCYGPAGQQLGTSHLSMSQQLGEVDFECGVIAGDRGFPLYSKWIPAPHDGRVSVESTKVSGMKDHKVIHRSHDGLLNSPLVFEASRHFLKHGWFEKSHG
jgi:hypothetical protein